MLTVQKFQNSKVTAQGKSRAFVDFTGWKTLWFNTGTLCNLECQNCYIESSPTNDRLSFITLEDIYIYLDEIEQANLPIKRLGFTGGEPFLNPHIMAILEESLERGLNCLVLTNAYRGIENKIKKIEALNKQFPGQLNLRISIDHYKPEIHEKERGANTFKRTLLTTKQLNQKGINISFAARSLTGESQEQMLCEFQSLFKSYGIELPLNQSNIVIFPEMDENSEVPEITTECWDILQIAPQDQMCAGERMIVKPKGGKCQVQACTLLPYQKEFCTGVTLKESMTKRIYLNHPHCAKFCVLGGASCSSTS